MALPQQHRRGMGSLPSSCIDQEEPFKPSASLWSSPIESDKTSKTPTPSDENSTQESSQPIDSSSNNAARRSKRWFRFWRSMKSKSFRGQSSSTKQNNDRNAQRKITLPKGTVLLRGCDSAEDHCELIRRALDSADGLHGKEGLKAIGFEYRLQPCDEHKDTGTTSNEVNEPIEETTTTREVSKELMFALKEESEQLQQKTKDSDVISMDGSESESSSRRRSLRDLESFNHKETKESQRPYCNLCAHRLFHCTTDTMVEAHNRQEVIADGKMYERVCELSQEAAQEKMMQEGDLEWMMIDDQKEPPLRVLVSKHRRRDTPIFVACTGRGKVRAGIFSRFHLLCSGLEMATAVPLVGEATKRGWCIAIVDPNVHGEAQGFTTFRKTMDFVTDKCFGSHQKLIYLCHSASGGHMARHLLDAPEERIRNIQAIAFTDSTHSVQWARTNASLLELLQSRRCVYFRSSREQDGIDENKWYLHAAGEPVQTDSFWVHRFGTISTLWAGTNEHSLTNWFAFSKIWQHYDSVIE